MGCIQWLGLGPPLPIQHGSPSFLIEWQLAFKKEHFQKTVPSVNSFSKSVGITLLMSQ